MNAHSGEIIIENVQNKTAQVFTNPKYGTKNIRDIDPINKKLIILIKKICLKNKLKRENFIFIRQKLKFLKRMIYLKNLFLKY